jgi:hypothetical protein
MALFRGDDDKQAETGALLIADAVDCLRTLRAFALAFGRKK